MLHGKILRIYSSVLRNHRFIPKVRFLQVTSVTNTRKSFEETSNELIDTEIAETSEENKAAFKDYFGIESDEGAILIDNNSSAKLHLNQFNLNDRNVNSRAQKFYVTSFGILRNDSENIPIRHGQYEESETDTSDVSEGSVYENPALSNFSFANANQRSNKQIVKPNVDLHDGKSDTDVNNRNRSVVSFDKSLSRTEKADKVNHKIESKNAINDEKSSFIDDIYFSDMCNNDSKTDLIKLDGINKDSDEITDLKNADINTCSYIDSLYFTNNDPDDQIISNNLNNVDKAKEFKNPDNLIENGYFPDKLKDVAQQVCDETTSFKDEIDKTKTNDLSKYNFSNQLNLHTETENEVDKFISKLSDDTNFSRKGFSQVTSTTTQTNQNVNYEYKSSEEPERENLDSISNRRENASKLKQTKEKSQQDSNLEFKDFQKSEVSASQQSLGQNHIRKTESFIFADTFKKMRNQYIGDKTEQHKNQPIKNVNKVLKVKVKTQKVTHAETKKLETAQDYVENIRKNSTDYSSLQDKTIAGRETLDSKGFRILENQVLKLSYFTRDEILGMLTKCVIYSDENIVVLNKPYNIVMHDSKTTKDPCLSTFLDDLAKELDRENPSPKLHIIHRLDKETTGCLLLARNEVTAEHLKSLFSQRRISKTYWIVTTNVPDPLEGIIDIPIAEGKIEDRTRMVLNPVIPDDVNYTSRAKRGKRAISHYKVIAIVGNSALVEVRPETGIKHQIRVHFGFGLSCPILGDHKYSHLQKLAPQKLPADILQRLHVRQSKVRHIPMHIYARDIVIPEYANGRNLFVSAPMPEHMRRNLKTLKFRKKDKL